MNKLDTPFQQFIALSKYARWIPELGRRETWEETVDRYVDFICYEQLTEPGVDEEVIDDTYTRDAS